MAVPLHIFMIKNALVKQGLNPRTANAAIGIGYLGATVGVPMLGRAAYRASTRALKRGVKNGNPLALRVVGVKKTPSTQQAKARAQRTTNSRIAKVRAHSRAFAREIPGVIKDTPLGSKPIKQFSVTDFHTTATRIGEAMSVAKQNARAELRKANAATKRRNIKAQQTREAAAAERAKQQRRKPAKAAAEPTKPNKLSAAPAKQQVKSVVPVTHNGNRLPAGWIVRKQAAPEVATQNRAPASLPKGWSFRTDPSQPGDIKRSFLRNNRIVTRSTQTISKLRQKRAEAAASKREKTKTKTT